jgi:hypothetical protein
MTSLGMDWHKTVSMLLLPWFAATCPVHPPADGFSVPTGSAAIVLVLTLRFACCSSSLDPRFEVLPLMDAVIARFLHLLTYHCTCHLQHSHRHLSNRCSQVWQLDLTSKHTPLVDKKGRFSRTCLENFVQEGLSNNSHRKKIVLSKSVAL